MVRNNSGHQTRIKEKCEFSFFGKGDTFSQNLVGVQAAKVNSEEY